jgi:hypothetical protein
MCCLLLLVLVNCGCRNVVQERSLLTGEVGMSTLRLQGPASKLDGYNSTARFLEQVCAAHGCRA